MRKFIFIIAILITGSCRGQNKNTKEKAMENSSKEVHHTEEEWKQILSPKQYHILREKGTDRPFTGKYYLTRDKGIYKCAACGNELFTSDMKFDSECGWPSFDKEIAGGKIKKKTDYSFGMVRTEILCAQCGSHLGHLFDDGPTATKLRYCVNSTSIDFTKK
ncbi:MAG: peptide-methionine (R)-S-oxide reductase MsrB [Bacteroidetes bacterium]|nr:peptide-methionine (R)-S-oxide reductase MsrB [Bacteroidota bacterium]